jgi:hypothetical protein
MKGKAALAEVARKFCSLHDEVRDPEVQKITSKRIGSETPRGVSESQALSTGYLFGVELKGEKVAHYSAD